MIVETTELERMGLEVGLFRPDEVLVVDRDEGWTVFQRSNSVSLDDMHAVIIWEKTTPDDKEACEEKIVSNFRSNFSLSIRVAKIGAFAHGLHQLDTYITELFEEEPRATDHDETIVKCGDGDEW